MTKQLGEIQKQLSDIKTQQNKFIQNRNNVQLNEFESNLFGNSEIMMNGNRNSIDILNSYVGEGKSFELNKFISETGDSKDNFAKRGTLFGGTQTSFFNAKNPFVFDKGLSVLNEKPKIEEYSHNNSKLNNTHDKNDIFKDSNTNSESNNMKQQVQNPFKNSVPAEENILNDLDKTNEYLEKKPHLQRISSLEGSEKLNMTIIEEEELEKKLISENLKKKDITKSRKGKDFNETMNNIYDDLDRTLQEIEKCNSETSQEIEKFEFDNLNILENVNLDDKDEKSIEQKQKKFESLKKDSFNINDFIKKDNDQSLKNDLKNSQFDFDENKKVKEIVTSEQNKPKKVEIIHNNNKQKEKELSIDEDDNKSIYSNILNQFIKPSPKIYTRKKMGSGKYAIHTQNSNNVETTSLYESKLKSFYYDKFENKNLNEDKSYHEIYLSHQNKKIRSSSAFYNAKKYDPNEIIVKKPIKNEWSKQIFDNSQLTKKKPFSEKQTKKNKFKFLQNNQPQKKITHRKTESLNTLNNFIRSSQKSLSNIYTPQNKGIQGNKTTDFEQKKDHNYHNNYNSKMKNNQNNSFHEIKSTLSILFSKIFVYTSKIENLKMKLHKEAGENICYSIFKQFCNAQTGELNINSLENIFNTLNFQIDSTSLKKILLYLNKYKIPSFKNNSNFKHKLTNQNLFSSFYNIKKPEQKEFQNQPYNDINYDQDNSIFSLINLQYEEFRELFISHKIVIPEIYLFCNWSGKQQSENMINQSSYYLLRQIVILFNKMLGDISRILKSIQHFDSNKVFDYIYNCGENTHNLEKVQSHKNFYDNSNQLNNKQENSNHPSFSNNITDSNIETYKKDNYFNDDEHIINPKSVSQR